MSDTNTTILQALGEIKGMLAAEIRLNEEHRKDDVRRFGDVFKRLDEHERDINQAKGAKGALLWLIGSGGIALGGVIAWAAKTFGH